MTGLPLEPFTMIRMAELIGRTLLHVFNFLVCATMDRCAEDAVSIWPMHAITVQILMPRFYGVSKSFCIHSTNELMWFLQMNVCKLENAWW